MRTTPSRAKSAAIVTLAMLAVLILTSPQGPTIVVSLIMLSPILGLGMFFYRARRVLRSARR